MSRTSPDVHDAERRLRLQRELERQRQALEALLAHPGPLEAAPADPQLRAFPRSMTLRLLLDERVLTAATRLLMARLVRGRTLRALHAGLSAAHVARIVADALERDGPPPR